MMEGRGRYRGRRPPRGGARFNDWRHRERSEKVSFSQRGDRDDYSRGMGRICGYHRGRGRGNEYSRGRGGRAGHSQETSQGYSSGESRRLESHPSYSWRSGSPTERNGRWISDRPSSAISSSSSKPERSDGASTSYEYRDRSYRTNATAKDVIRPIGYGKLASMKRDKSVTPQSIVISLGSSSSGLEELLKEKFGNNMTEILLQVFGKMADSDGPTQFLTPVLQLILEYKFLEKIRSLILATKCASDGTAPVSLYRGSQKSGTDAHLQMQNALNLMKSLMTVLPNDSCEEVAITIYFLDPMIRDLRVVDAKIREYYDEISVSLTNYRDKQQRKAALRTTRRNRLDDLHSQPAPDDFRDIPVFPRLSDINEDIQPFIRTNLINKAYENVDHYLDVQFRLLREDFIRPLREGIAEIKRHKTTAPGDYRRKRFDNVKVYHGVVVQQLELSRQNGVMYRIQFNAEILQRVRWRNTKRLLHGNLLCLSSDEFREEVIFAVVVDRDPKHLQDGLLTIQFVSNNDREQEEEIEDDQLQNAEDVEEGVQFPNQNDHEEENAFPNAWHVKRNVEKETRLEANTCMLDMKKTYTMVETDAYFEAYKHILAGLKETEAIPLDRYIVHYEENVYAPRYLRGVETGVQYDFTPVAKNEKKVEILKEDWPTLVELGLDPSQRDAVKLALTKELAIIQGPPGTGKTHVGLVIMKILLRNKESWSDVSLDRRKRNFCPILVVCYTNHALDQFVEGIAKFSSSRNERIVRVGGRCKNEEIKQFSLKEIKYSGRYRAYGIDADHVTIERAIRTLKGDLGALEEELQTNERKLEASRYCIPSLGELENFIPPNLFQQFRCAGEPDSPGVSQSRFSTPMLELLLEECRSSRVMSRYITGDEHYQRSRKRLRIDDALLLWLGISVRDQVPEEANQILLTKGHTEENIKKAYNATNDQSELLQDRDKFTEELQQISGNLTPDVMQTLLCTERPSNSETERDEGIEEQNESQEESGLVEERRFLDTDAILGMANMEGERSRTLKMQVMVKRISAISLADFEECGEEDPEQASNEEWQETRQQKRRMKKKLKVVIRGTSTMTENEEKHVDKIFSLRQEDKERLFRTWIARWRQGCRIGSERRLEIYSRLASQLKELRRQEDAGILRRADVIAVTTTGAAKYRDLIYRLNCKIVVVEEAAEVLDAHIVTAMPKSTEHLILIGDHRQLKPSATVFELARKYKMDISLFERLIKKIPHVTLCRQHRMRPAIADLIRPHIYENLQDDDSVLGRSNITGIQKPLFFLSHTVAEESLDDGRSKKNPFEAEFLIALCKYIIKQGYLAEQITIITMYTGQIFAFRGKEKEEGVPDGVRVTAVDNFQGEENDIILLSLVRSNEELLGSKSETWDTIVQHLRAKECIGDSLILQCKHHPDRLSPVKNAKDFSKVPEGGCGHPCKARLKCGHVCPKPCHPYEHDFPCLKPCDRIIPCEYKHPCKRKCFQSCTPCPEQIPKIIPKCGHTQRVPCPVPPEKFNCMVSVEVKLPCRHLAQIPCWQSYEPKASMCKEKCKDLLECGHDCGGSCYECHQGRLHVPCSKTCGRVIVCGHSCSAYCSSCPPCREKCRTKCNHSDCKKICGEPCVLCKEKCRWACPHYKCTKKCSEPCNRPPCNEPCPERLKKCKHPCIGLCGEPCPKLCRICDETRVQEIFFGDEGNARARFVQLEDCGHIFTYRSLDRWMNQNEVGNAIKMKECPRCKTTIWRSTRYGTIINQLLNSLNKVKIKIWGSALQEQSRLRNQLETEIRKFANYGNEFGFNELRKMQINLQAHLSVHEVILLGEKLKRLTALRKLKEEQGKIGPNSLQTKPLREDLHRMLKWVCLRRTQTTIQEEQSFRRETERIVDAMKFIDINRKHKERKLGVYTEEIDDDTDDALEKKLEPMLTKLKTLLLESMEPYHDAKKSEVRRLFQDISDLASNLSSTLRITHEEREMICKAMGFATKGHWYACPKGHVYAIGECGGATTTGSCPECKEQIGGSSHRLLASNRVAKEMDGASHPAYDPTNNRIPQALLDEMRRDGFG